MTMLPAGPVRGRTWRSAPASRSSLAAALVRTACRLLILAAVTISCVQLFAVHLHDPLEHGHAGAGESGWLIPLVALAAAVVALVIAVVPIVGPVLGTRDAGTRLRVGLNGLLWGVIVMLAVQFTGAAFAAVPGGHELVGLVLGSAMAVVTSHTHRRSIGNDTYRTFNLMAMLLAAGSLASMSLTPTGRWWTHNFSTLGTSDDIAAMCFNGAMVLSGGGIALMSGALTRALTASRFAVRRRGLVAMRVLISLIGVSLMGVGFVPIDGATGLHDTFASTAGASFGALVVGARWFARRMPRTLVVVSDVFLAFLATAWVAYALLSIVNLTLFEVAAFTLVFVWLITLVVTTHRAGESAPASAAAPRADAAPARAAAPEPGAMATPRWEWARGPTARPTRWPGNVLIGLRWRTFALDARGSGIPKLRPRFPRSEVEPRALNLVSLM